MPPTNDKEKDYSWSCAIWRSQTEWCNCEPFSFRSNVKVFRRSLFMRNKKILVVDDDADIRFGYQVLLTAHHYDTFVASDASSTLTEVDAHKPDLIILDLDLPTGPRPESSLPL